MRLRAGKSLSLTAVNCSSLPGFVTIVIFLKV
jgi:hypothetical protein